MIYAEVIGDPVAQSKSATIHKHWLAELGIQGDYLRTHVTADELSDFFGRRRDEPNWRGCNVTIPHKESILPLLDGLDPVAEAIGAINCVVEEDGALMGYNTDIDGIAAALGSSEVRARKTVVIGAGGAARAVVAYLSEGGADPIVLVVRNSQRAEPLRALAPNVGVCILDFAQADAAFTGASAIINASPLGMAGAPGMPTVILEAAAAHVCETTVFDLVTTPVDTALLKAARKGGAAQTIDGLTMLVGQARRAFELFFASTPPQDDAELRNLLTQSGSDR